MRKHVALKFISLVLVIMLALPGIVSADSSKAEDDYIGIWITENSSPMFVMYGLQENGKGYIIFTFIDEASNFASSIFVNASWTMKNNAISITHEQGELSAGNNFALQIAAGVQELSITPNGLKNSITTLHKVQ